MEGKMVTTSGESEYLDFTWTPPKRRTWLADDHLQKRLTQEYQKDLDRFNYMDVALTIWWEEDSAVIMKRLSPLLKQGWHIHDIHPPLGLVGCYRLAVSDNRIHIYPEDKKRSENVILATVFGAFIGAWCFGYLGGMLFGGAIFTFGLIYVISKMFGTCTYIEPKAWNVKLIREKNLPKEIEKYQQPLLPHCSRLRSYCQYENIYRQAWTRETDHHHTVPQNRCLCLHPKYGDPVIVTKPALLLLKHISKNQIGFVWWDNSETSWSTLREFETQGYSDFVGFHNRCKSIVNKLDKRRISWFFIMLVHNGANISLDNHPNIG
jgi:hypothetical protein